MTTQRDQWPPHVPMTNLVVTPTGAYEVEGAEAFRGNVFHNDGAGLPFLRVLRQWGPGDRDESGRARPFRRWGPAPLPEDIAHGPGGAVHDDLAAVEDVRGPAEVAGPNDQPAPPEHAALERPAVEVDVDVLEEAPIDNVERQLPEDAEIRIEARIRGERVERLRIVNYDRSSSVSVVVTVHRQSAPTDGAR